MISSAVGIGCRSLLYLPTHRPCAEVIADNLREVGWAADRGADRILYCVIEDRLPKQTSALHLEALRRARLEFEILHMTDQRRRAFIDAVLESSILPTSDCKRLRPLLSPVSTSYGAGPNLAYLISAAAGCRFVHRRDSDVHLDSNRPNELPIELELTAISKHLDEISVPVRNADRVRPGYDLPVAAVGTGTFGSPTFDRRDLFVAGESFVIRHWELGSPLEWQEARRRALGYLVDEPELRYDDDFFEVDFDNRVEMESCCIADLYWQVPEMPTDILGCDYMVKDVAALSDRLVLFHSRKMLHSYDTAREANAGSGREAVAYALRDLKYLQICRIWRAHDDRIRRKRSVYFEEGQLRESLYCESFRSAAAESSEEVQAIRNSAKELYRAAAIAAPKPASVRLGAVAAEIERMGDRLDRQVRQAVDDFCFLIERWGCLMDAAAARGMSVLSEARVAQR
jgi:hypothetical protein